MYHNGIRIATQEGTPVQAAADGVVIFSSPLKDYGETIIIQHAELYATVYAHLGARTVRGEVKVKRGDRIAFIGKPAANAAKEEAVLHFEIRHNNKARNPLFFLP
jgi:lipoprotein NlpD